MSKAGTREEEVREAAERLAESDNPMSDVAEAVLDRL